MSKLRIELRSPASHAKFDFAVRELAIESPRTLLRSAPFHLCQQIILPTRVGSLVTEISPPLHSIPFQSNTTQRSVCRVSVPYLFQVPVSSHNNVASFQCECVVLHVICRILVLTHCYVCTYRYMTDGRKTSERRSVHIKSVSSC